MNGLQTVKHLCQMIYNASFLPQLYFCSVTQNDYLQGESIWKGFQLYFRKANNSKRNKVSTFKFFSMFRVVITELAGPSDENWELEVELLMK